MLWSIVWIVDSGWYLNSLSDRQACSGCTHMHPTASAHTHHCHNIPLPNATSSLQESRRRAVETHQENEVLASQHEKLLAELDGVAKTVSALLAELG